MFTITFPPRPPNMESYLTPAELVFEEKPDRNLLIAGCTEAVKRFRTANNFVGVLGWRHVWEDGNRFQIFIVDVALSSKLETKTTDDFYICEVTLTCKLCRSQYKGWMNLLKRTSNPGPYWMQLEYCPQCPPVEIKTWLTSTVGLTTEKPQYVQRYQVAKRVRQPEITLSAEDMMDFE